MSERHIALEAWKRRPQFEYYRAFEYPQFNVCCELEVRSLRDFTRAEGMSFYHALVWLSAKAANAVEEFRYRIRGEAVVVHDQVHPNFTFLRSDETFGFCEARYEADGRIFLEGAQAAEAKARASAGLHDEEGRDDYLFVTCLPWVSFTSISHPVKLGAQDSVPRLSWGKYRAAGDSLVLPYSVQVNHALADGFHVGCFVRELESLLARPARSFGAR
jgi:chloramphenicol O-acetyltransferase type A